MFYKSLFHMYYFHKVYLKCSGYENYHYFNLKRGLYNSFLHKNQEIYVIVLRATLGELFVRTTLKDHNFLNFQASQAR